MPYFKYYVTHNEYFLFKFPLFFALPAHIGLKDSYFENKRKKEKFNVRTTFCIQTLSVRRGDIPRRVQFTDYLARIELNAILQYIYHSFYFEKYGFHDIAETLKSIAVAEMRHLDLLGETILALGAPPVFCRFPYYGFDYYSAKYVAYSRSLKFMLEDDLLGERQAARDYCRMENALKNSAVKEIVSRIREDELLHIKTLENILKDFKG